MGEIFKPTEDTYFRAYGPDGTMHEGVTPAGLVTTTGQPSFIYSADPAEFAGMVADSDSAVLPMPPEGVEVSRGQVYDFEGTVYVCVQDHTRTAFPPDQTPALFTPARAQYEPWVQPIGSEDAYDVDDYVTHPNAQDGGTVWVFRSKIPDNVTEPGTDGELHRWWEPIEPVSPDI